MTPPNPFDQASRYTAKLNAPGFVDWLLRGLPATLRFRDQGAVGAGSSEVSATTGLAGLPATWTSGAAYTDGRLSAWAAGAITLLGAFTCGLGSPGKDFATKLLAVLGIAAGVLAVLAGLGGLGWATGPPWCVTRFGTS